MERESSTDELSQELRFSSAADRPFRYSGGLYFYQTKFEGVTRGTVATKALPADFGSFCLACTFLGPATGWVDFAQGAADATFLPWFNDKPLGGGTDYTTFLTEDKAYAAFASIDWDFLENWTARVEGRYTRTEKEFEDRVTSGAGDDSWGTTDWRGTLRYKPAENMTLYGSIGHAEKAGGFDIQNVQFQDNPGVNVSVFQTFDPEKNTTYEVGFKSEFLDRRLRSDIAIFYIDWTEIVIPQGQESIDGRPLVTPVAFNVNSGDASITGAEFSIDASITDRLSANVGVSYQDAEYGDAALASYELFPSFAPDGSVKGNTILWTSEWQATVGAGYQAPLRGKADWYLRSDASYRGPQFQDAGNQARVRGSTTVNAHLGVTSGSWTVELFALNLLGNDEPTGAYRDVFFSNTIPGTPPVNNSGTFFPWRYSVSYPRLEQYGVTWRMRF